MPAPAQRSFTGLPWSAAACAVCAAALFSVLARGVGLAVPPGRERTEAEAKPAHASPAPLPERLSETGLFLEGSTRAIDPRNLPFVPQYPLWTDGAVKRRWIRLPEGSAIDAHDPDSWQFPAGTRLWKEFSFGRRVETRYMERLPDGSWRFATYLWDEDGSDARLMPAEKGALVEVGSAEPHEVPNESDCRACHEGRRSPVLGATALQLSPDRDPNAPHREPVPPGSVDLPALVARGLLVGLPERLLREPPRIASDSPRERAALGYLYGNCSGCHNAEGPIASVGLDFDQRVATPSEPRAWDSAVGRPSGFSVPGTSATLRIAPGDPDASAVAYRMGSRFPATQMPPLGTRRVDHAALELVRSWIANDLPEVSNGKRERP